ncbi:MAG: VanZ family protein [Ketobacteraceae bacterium]|nr:VanZ family protein [Ketobacteraceae bacterium]
MGVSPKVTYGFRFLLSLALVVMTYLLLNKPSGNVSGWMINDKVAHGLGFFVLAGVTDLAFPRSSFVWKALPLCAYGLLTEYLQLQTGYRHFSWWDWLADIVGVVCFMPFRRPVYRWLERWFPRQNGL